MRIERDVQQKLEALGYDILSGGWPDLLVTKDGELVCAVELKDFGDSVKPQQALVHELLRRAGVKVHVVHACDLERFLWGMKELTPDWKERAEHKRRLEAAWTSSSKELWDDLMRQPPATAADAS